MADDLDDLLAQLDRAIWIYDHKAAAAIRSLRDQLDAADNVIRRLRDQWEPDDYVLTWQRVLYAHTGNPPEREDEPMSPAEADAMARATSGTATGEQP